MSTNNKIIIIGYIGCLMDEEKKPVGMKGVGKDTCADFVSEIFNGESHRLSFADPLKNLISSAYNLPRKIFDTNEMKEELVIGDWSYRKLLEVFGTDVARNGLSEIIPSADSIWLSQVVLRIKRLQLPKINQIIASMFGLSDYDAVHLRNIPGINISLQTITDHLTRKMNESSMPPFTENPILIQITDVRFYNEYKVLKDLGAKLIQVNRYVRRQSIEEQQETSSNHVSNKYDDRLVADFTVENISTKSHLRYELVKISKNFL